MPSLAVIDTNVIVAGLLTARNASPVVRILDGMLSAAFPYAISEALLAEYGVVLRRSSLRKLHGLTSEEIDTILVELVQHAILLDPKPAPSAPDPGDQHLWELLAAHPDVILVTGDKLLIRDNDEKGRVISPADFVKKTAGLREI
jgi:putative PIN family toxin of toxin-antitoxin system